jgi:serine/threonine protein kinase/tetratricopeptide (TPR) repeat protein
MHTPEEQPSISELHTGPAHTTKTLLLTVLIEAHPVIGKIISRYHIGNKIGEGGMGVVYKAEDTRLKRTVALKFLPPELTRDPEAKDRFAHEAQAASALDHPNICTIYEINDTEDGQMFMAMGFYEGETLEQRIKKGPLPLDEATSIATQTALGLARAHEAGIVHRDIKPANIIITTRGEVKIVDFGLAKLGGRPLLTKVGTMLGTVAYMSPEQARGESTDQRTDIWSLGVLLFEMLTGERPFQSDYETAVVYSVLNEDPKNMREIRSDVPEALEEIVRRAMAKRPEERYQSAAGLLTDLEAYKEGKRLPAIREPKRKVSRSKPIRVLLALLAMVPVIVGGILVTNPGFFDLGPGSKKVSIAILSCENQTGDGTYADLEYIIPDVLTRYLSRVDDIEVAPFTRMLALADALESKDASLEDEITFIDRDIAGKLSQQGKFTIQLTPTVSTLPSGESVVAVEIKDTEGGTSLGTAGSKGVPLRDILTTVPEFTLKIAEALGIARAKAEPILQKVYLGTTASLDAYRHFVLAKYKVQRLQVAEGKSHVLHAIENDSTFASAYDLLARTEAGDFNYARALEIQSMADKYRQFGSGLRETDLLAWRDRYGLSSLRRREALQRSYVEKHPEDESGHVRLGVILRNRGKIEQAIEQNEIALALNPAHAHAINELAWIQALYRADLSTAISYLNRLESVAPPSWASTGGRGVFSYMEGDIDHALYLFEKAYRTAPSWNIALVISYVYALKEDYDLGEAWIDKHLANAKSPFFRGQGYLWRAYLDIWRGRSARASANIAACVSLADSIGHSGLRAQAQWLKLWSSLGTQPINKLTLDERTWADSTGHIQLCNPWYPYYSGLVDLRQGRTDSVGIRIRELRGGAEQIFSRDAAIRRCLAGFLDQDRLLAQDSAAAAAAYVNPLPDFTTLVPHINIFIEPGEDGPRTSLLFSFSGDVLARAYLAMGNVERAVLEYERLVRADPARKLWIPPLYHFRLAELYERSGAPERAIAHYNKFLEIWNRAESTHEEPLIARARLGALERETRQAKVGE